MTPAHALLRRQTDINYVDTPAIFSMRAQCSELFPIYSTDRVHAKTVTILVFNVPCIVAAQSEQPRYVRSSNYDAWNIGIYSVNRCT